jgi:hypothetical protein
MWYYILQVHVFFNLPNAESLDNFIFLSLPIMKEIGNQVHQTVKAIMPADGIQ